MLPGLQIAQKDLQAGEAALKERDYRRMGLGVSLLAIVLAIVVPAVFAVLLGGATALLPVYARDLLGT